MNFDDLLESHEDMFESIDEMLDDLMIESFSDEEIMDIADELGIQLESIDDLESISDDDLSNLHEQMQRRVTSRGNVSRVKNKKTRSRRATSTTGMSKTALRKRARKSARTRKRKPGQVRKAIKKRNRALRKRKNMNIKSGS